MASEQSTGTVTKPSDSSEAQLHECLTSIYDASRAAAEMSGLESKLDSLTSIRKTLISGDNISPGNLEQMDKTIEDLQAKIADKRKEINEAEQKVVTGFIRVITNVSGTTMSVGEDIVARCSAALKTFSETLHQEFRSTALRTEAALNELRENKMDITDRKTLQHNMEEFQAHITKTQKENVQEMRADSAGLFTTITEKIGLLCRQFDPVKVAATVEEEVFAKLDDKIQAQLREFSHETERAIGATNEKVGNIPGTITNAVKQLISDNISPGNMQRLIQGLPEYQAMKEAGAQLAANNNSNASIDIDPQHLPNFEAIKESVGRLSHDLVEVKQCTQQLRETVDLLRTQRVGPITAIEPGKFDFLVAVKRMEEMEREMSVIHNNVKMMETLVTVKSTAAATTDEQQMVVGHKRARIEGMSSDNANTEILAMLNEVESKHQKLLDFILQCKDTVLDDLFPSRLEAAMVKIEQVLMNHESFIRFLVDPFAAAQQKTLVPQQVPEGMLSPAMIDAISQLVQKTTQESTEPLEKKIKLLEEKLNSRS
ncbi:hypothetical protein INT47_003833 [Mucor saturninus]|uniref:Uncharacterized protein n=1 Tax=Mucor saturninus TaxID=64648 RepID=A0A8H7UT01_9FUNG|nr:hypothetical protein INT47_003833 [Mucor saturninus]